MIRQGFIVFARPPPPPKTQIGVNCPPKTASVVGDPHVINFQGNKVTISGKPGTALAIFSTGQGSSTIRVGARLAAWAPRPGQTVLSRITVIANKTTTVVTTVKSGKVFKMTAAVKDANKMTHMLKAGGMPFKTGSLDINFSSAQKLVIATPLLTIIVDQVC